MLVERSIIGWKEFELEVMRDGADNVVIVCSIENLDPMGVHTGDSITVAPVMTLTDREYQVMRDAAIRIIREIGVAAGGCNIQFAVSPTTGEQLVIEMNPRVSRSSALASKATGFPIARIGTKVAVGYRLDELPNDITRTTPASFEPVLDYVVVKIPRFAFEKFPAADPTLTTQMKSVGEVMAIGRTFKEAFQKGLRGLEVDRAGWVVGATPADDRLQDTSREAVLAAIRTPTPERIFQIKYALQLGITVEAIAERTGIDPWFLYQLEELLDGGERVGKRGSGKRGSVGRGGRARGAEAQLLKMKRLGFSDRQLADLRGATEAAIRAERHRLGIRPAYKTVDTCAGEFPSSTPYLYSSYDEENEARPSGEQTVMILGSGPNRIGQGVEFDYCCVRAAMAFRELGYRTVMVNSNPETVSTDFDISDALYFEPLTLEDVLEVVAVEQPIGVVVQLGGQTPLRLARALEREGVRILGTSSEAIDLAEDRGKFEAITRELGVAQPPSGMAQSVEEAVAVAARVGYPVLVRPSYVLGGRAMEIVYDDSSLRSYFERGGPGVAGAPGAHRQLSGGCLRGRRRRHCRRHPLRDRRSDAAHRGRRHPLRRLRLRPASLPDHRRPGGGDAATHPRLCRAARGGGPAQRAVRHQERRGLRARGQPARVPHGAVRVQDDRSAAGQPGGGGHGREDPRGSGPARRRAPALCRRQGGGVPLQQAPGCGSDPGAGDALDRRGHGHSRLVRNGLRQGPDLGRWRASARGLGVRHRERPRQGQPGSDCAPVSRAGVPAAGHRRHRPLPPGARHSHRASPQGVRGTSQRHRPAGLGPDPAADQHAAWAS